MVDSKTKDSVARLRAMTAVQLKDEYARAFGGCGSRLGDVFARRRLAYRIQAEACGDYTPAQKMMFVRMAQRDHRVNPSATASRKPPLPVRGVTYVRTYKGKLYEARATGYNQFEMDGRVYRSLTACVFAITGQHYSGRKWFRLKGAL